MKAPYKSNSMHLIGMIIAATSGFIAGAATTSFVWWLL